MLSETEVRQWLRVEIMKLDAMVDSDSVFTQKQIINTLTGVLND